MPGVGFIDQIPSNYEAHSCPYKSFCARDVAGMSSRRRSGVSQLYAFIIAHHRLFSYWRPVDFPENYPQGPGPPSEPSTEVSGQGHGSQVARFRGEYSTQDLYANTEVIARSVLQYGGDSYL